MKKGQPNIGIQIGVSKETVAEGREAIIAILNCNADQETIREALRSLVAICHIDNVTIANNSIITGTGEES